MNNFSQKTPQELVDFVKNLLTAAQSTPAAFGWTAAELTALTASQTATSQAIDSLAAAKASVKSSVSAKAAGKERVAQQLADLAKKAYLDPDVDDVLLAQVGLAPRRGGSSRPSAAAPVTGLLAAPNANGTVRLSWDRGSNPASTMFVIETSPDGLAWTYLKSVTRVTYLATGFDPGETAWFRVTATTSTSAGLPSSPVPIYAPASTPVTLRLAA